MRLATIRTAEGGTTAGRVDDDQVVPLNYPDVGTLLESAGMEGLHRLEASGDPMPESAVDYAPVVTNPSKILCVGLNYRSHILEMGRELPTHPTLFAKFADSLLGACDDLVLPAVSQEVDWEVELAFVVGAPMRRATTDEAQRAIAGYTIVNDVSMRDWQWRTTQWLQGKTFEASTPAGPYLVTPDEVDDARDLRVCCEVDGAVMQESRTSDLLFGPAETAAYISQFVTLRPGDLIATGTPGGVGSARTPKVFLKDGNKMRTAIEGLGQCLTSCVNEKVR
jgi:acylpyruvate hydrolase